MPQLLAFCYPLIAASIGLLSFAPSAGAEVLVVDLDSSGQAHRTIQSAIDAAAPGDTILVRSPEDALANYGGFVVDGKPLTIRGEGRPYLRTGAAIVQNIAVGDTLILKGLDLNRTTFGSTTIPTGDTSGPGLTVAASSGAVRLVDCSFQGSHGVRAWAGVQLIGALDVALEGCEVLGADGPLFGDTGSSGLQAVSSRLAVYSSSIRGGRGYSEQSSTLAYGADGGTGLGLFSRSVAWIASSHIQGGAGGDAACTVYICDDFPGDGGTGLQVATGSVCFESGSTMAGGTGGEVGSLSSFPNGRPGQDSIGSYTSDPTTDVLSSVERSAVRDGEAAQITVFGSPGESVRVAVARGGGFRFLGPSRGVLQVSDLVGSYGLIPLGVIPSSGFITADVALPQGAASGDASAYFLQAVVDEGASSADFRMSKPFLITVDGADVPSIFDREVVRVDHSASPGGDGRSWGTACRTLEEALALLPFGLGGEVWLRSGTHRVGSQGGVPIGSHVRLLGGFSGTETSAQDADPEANPTWFDGDINGDGSTGAASVDNSASILRLGAPGLGLLAEGIEVRGLNFRNCASGTLGAGAVVVYGEVLVDQCRFVSNHVCAIRHQAGALSVRRSKVIANRSFRTAGIVCSGVQANGIYTSLDVESCVFSGNEVIPSSTASCAAIQYSQVDSLRVSASTFYANQGNIQPGAIFANSVAEVWVSNSVFWGNSTNPVFNLAITSQCHIWNIPSLLFQYCSAPDFRLAYQTDGNLIGDPMFVDEGGANGVIGDEDDDLRLGSGSHGIDAGNSLYLRPWSVLDVAGSPRRMDDPTVPDTGVGGAPVVDMGAYER